MIFPLPLRTVIISPMLYILSNHWERLHTPDFKLVEFDQFRNEAGYNQGQVSGRCHSGLTPRINVKEVLRLWTFNKGLNLLDFAKMRYNLLGSAGHWFPGQPAVDALKQDWSCLSASPFSARIPEILNEAHHLFHTDEEAKRLSES
jgi:predicted aldo/keto reductase-like oxidoreductase